MVKYLRTYVPSPGEKIDATDLAMQRVRDYRKHQANQARQEAMSKRAFGFKGSNVTRLNADWMRSPQSADSELRYALRNLRFRCRELERNNDWMRKLLGLFEDNVVGASGILLQMKIYNQVTDPITKQIVRSLDSRACEKIEAAWKEQCEPANYTVTRKDSAVATDKLCIRSIVRDGDLLIRKVRGYKNRFGYAVMVLEADYLDDFYNDQVRRVSNGNDVRMGVEVDEWKCPQAYWLLETHPGDFAYGMEVQGVRTRWSADEILHPYVKERPEQSRGYPWAVAAMNRFNMLGGYEEAELVAARMAACKGVYYTTDRPQVGEMGGFDGEGGEFGPPPETLEPGMNAELPQGMKPMVVDLQHPNANFPAFTKAQLRAAASSCGVSYVSLANDLENVNFSSIRAGLLDERETYKGVQTFYVDTAKNPIFEDWLEWVLLGGQLGIGLKATDFAYLNQKQYKCRRWDWVDPLKDINAAVTAIEAGLTTRSEVIADRGGDYEDVMAELNYEKEFEQGLGLNFGSAQPSTQKPNFPDSDKGDDDEDLKQAKSLQALLESRKQIFQVEHDPAFKALEKRVADLVLKLEERHNPNHAEQPRHDETGQWVAMEKKIDSMVDLIQKLVLKKEIDPAAIASPESPNDPKPDEDNDDDDDDEDEDETRTEPGTEANTPKGCVMVNLSSSDAKPIEAFATHLKAGDLAPDGIETEPHITVLYGLTSNDVSPVAEVCHGFGPITAMLGPVEVFENAEYDVLKIDVISPDLERLNAALRALPHENSYPTYDPHLTVAYLQSGKGKDYAGSDTFKDTMLVFDAIVFSDAEKTQTTIPLGPIASAEHPAK